jgi:hypothetical protein
MKTYFNKDSLKDIEGSLSLLPANDIFYNFSRYISNHYELLGEVVDILYADKPDIEFTLQCHPGQYETEKEAFEARSKLESKVIADIETIQTGKWMFIGPFKENRDKMKLSPKDAESMNLILEQQEADAKLSAELVNKRVTKAKQDTIAKHGADNKGLEEYKSALSTISAMGGKTLTKDEKEKLENAQRIKEMNEVPTDSVQIDIFGPNEKGEFTKNKFYTEAEAPEFLLKNNHSENSNETKSDNNEKHKTLIQSRSGQTMDINELRKRISN